MPGAEKAFSKSSLDSPLAMVIPWLVYSPVIVFSPYLVRPVVVKAFFSVGWAAWVQIPALKLSSWWARTFKATGSLVKNGSDKGT